MGETCFVCHRDISGEGHRYCDCRTDALCHDCFDSHTAACPWYQIGDWSNDDVGVFEDDDWEDDDWEDDE